MDNTICITCRKRILSHAYHMKCSMCERCAHIQCIAFTREDRCNTKNWICTLCTSDLFPFQSLDTNLLNITIMSDSINSTEVNLDAYANKILNPFNLNELDINEPNFDIDPDMHCFNEVGHDLLSKCNYFTEDSFRQWSENNKDDSNFFSIFHHNIRSLSANQNQLNVLLENMGHSFSIMGLSETWLDSEKYDLFQFSGYAHVGKTRNNQRGGGISLFIKNSYSFKERTDLSNFDDVYESIFIEIHKSFTGHKKDIVVG